MVRSRADGAEAADGAELRAWWWALWIRATWPLARLGRVDEKLRALSFIHFAHWSLAAAGRGTPHRRPDRGAARTLVFLTTFDGSDVQYIDAFVRVVPWRIRGLYAGTRGFTSARRSRPVERYIAEHNHAPEPSGRRTATPR